MLKKLKPVKPQKRVSTAGARGGRADTPLENDIVDLALSGGLKSAARDAVSAQLRQGIPVTYKKGNQVVKHYPDGREEVLGTVPAAKFTLPKGVRVFRPKK
jgi:hypothetical protein